MNRATASKRCRGRAVSGSTRCSHNRYRSVQSSSLPARPNLSSRRSSAASLARAREVVETLAIVNLLACEREPCPAVTSVVGFFHLKCLTEPQQKNYFAPRGQEDKEKISYCLSELGVLCGSHLFSGSASNDQPRISNGFS